MQNALIVAINDPSFRFELPKLQDSSWETLTRPDNDHERERLEYVGDGLMNACVGLQLYEMFPRGSPGLYTVSVFESQVERLHC